jgi:hypothetical protein
MLTLDPPVQVRLLSLVTPGSLVQFGSARGFCAVSSRDPNKTRVMIMYDAGRGSFEHRQTPFEVLDFGADLFIAPNLKSLVGNLDATSEATTELMLLGDLPKLVFRVEATGPRDSGLRLLDLKTGAIESLPRTNSRMSAFREWTVRLNTVSAGVLPLLDVGPSSGSAGEDTGLLDRA